METNLENDMETLGPCKGLIPKTFETSGGFCKLMHHLALVPQVNTEMLVYARRTWDLGLEGR